MLSKVRVPAVLRDEPAYRMLLGSQVLSVLGDRVRMVALPVEARIPSGRIRVTKNVVETVALPIVVHGDRLPSAIVSEVEG